MFSPQQGRELTKLHLTAAAGTLGATDDDVADAIGSPPSDRRFRYVKEILHGRPPMLEFEPTVEGDYANGVDIITCDDHGMMLERLSG